MEKAKDKARVAVDIGGTFTDLCLERKGTLTSVKVLTTPRAPEEGVLAGMEEILKQTGVKPAELGLIIHGTTLATNAIIERKGARTALVVTEGFRDSIEIAFEHRFEQYDIFMQKPPPLVPRDLRFGIPERMDGRGNVLIPLDEAAVRALAPKLKAQGIESVAIGYMHAYLDGKHERRTRGILAELLPGVSITLSSEVSPEIREYERWSTAVANAYVQPVMARYLGRLDDALRAKGVACPLFLITSGGGGNCAQVPDPPGRVGSRRRRHPGRVAGAPVRARQGAELRHGRHHRQDLPDRSRRAAAFAHLRSGSAVPLPQGQRPAAAHPGDRDGRDRRRRRLDRLGRSAGAHQCRPRERRCRTGP